MIWSSWLDSSSGQSSVAASYIAKGCNVFDAT